MSNTPDDEKAIDAFEIDIMEIILKHRAEDGISAVDVGATLVNILFIMATTQPNPKEATDKLKEALDSVCKAWYEANKPDVLKGMIDRCLMAKVVNQPKTEPESQDDAAKSLERDPGYPMPQKTGELTPTCKTYLGDGAYCFLPLDHPGKCM